MIEIEELPVIYKTKNFKRIVIEFLYTYPRKDNSSLLGSLLLGMIHQKSNNYNTEELFSNALIENYILSFSISKGIRGDNLIFNYHIEIPDPLVLSDPDYNIENTLAFLKDLIYNPYKHDNAFYKEELDFNKNKLKSSLENDLQNINFYCGLKLMEIVDDEEINYDEIHKHIKDLADINEKELFNFYKNFIGNKKPFIFMLGNISDKLKKQVANIFSDNLIPCTISTDYIKPLTYKGKTKIINESKNYSQSILKYAYKIDNYTKDDIAKLTVLNFLLSSQASNILFDYLRTKENLVYTAASSCVFDNGVFIITAQISFENKDQTIKTIDEVMKKLLDKNFLSKRLESVKKRKYLDLESMKDYKNSLIADMADNYLHYRTKLREEYKTIKNFNEQDIIDFISRLKLDTIYFLEGKHE